MIKPQNPNMQNRKRALDIYRTAKSGAMVISMFQMEFKLPLPFAYALYEDIKSGVIVNEQV